MRFRELLGEEFERRRQRNSKYSLRAFARLLGVHHATLSRLLNSTTPVQSRTIEAIGPRLGFSAARITALVFLEDTAAVVHGISRDTFRPDSRWLASVSGISVDRVNVALHVLVRSGRLQMTSATHWSLRESGNR